MTSIPQVAFSASYAPRAPERRTTEAKSSSPHTWGARAKLLADNGEYVLGVPRKKSTRERTEQCHHAFVEEVRKCADATGEPVVRAVLAFLQGPDRDKLALPDDFDPDHVCTFRVDGVLPIHLESVKAYWAAAAGGDENAKASEVMQCLICGRRRPAVKRLQFKIKRIPGGQTAGNALISANKTAFESYGLEASLIAPTCTECGERFSKAANALIEDEASHITIGPLVYLFWTKEESGFSVASMLSKPDPEEVRALIASALGGKESATEIDPMPFYATAFSASGARVAVRDWLDSTVGVVRRNLARYFSLQRVVDADGGEGSPLALYPLAVATVRDAADLSPSLPRALLRVALQGGPLPEAILYQAVQRNRAERKITRPRAALIKMVLLSQQTDFSQEDVMVQLDADNQEPAYLCGRLLAVLERIQQLAIPGAGSTITDRFYGTFSSAPASVAGTLLRKSQAHLAKLRKERPGAESALQGKLEEIQVGLSFFPRTLTLEQQGLFGLGYYHQRAQDRADAIARKHEKDQQATAEPSA
ncbi:MAG: type I-C CRISPR-associated protein Cas8c/Csd1 [Thermoguttaceae bacterium]|nr:type I-C CRISPR-associated protein Cas8c/Csd1 [Thermoguttaceae bacterium]